MNYAWTKGARLRGNPQSVGDELTRIKDTKSGRFKPEDVVRKAKAKRSVLHQYFDWDDSTASAKYRIEQAKYLIRCVQVVVVTETMDEPRAFRAFVSIERDNSHSYMDTQTVLSDSELRAQMLESALKELASFKQKYKDLTELESLFDAMDNIFEVAA